MLQPHSSEPQSKHSTGFPQSVFLIFIFYPLSFLFFSTSFIFFYFFFKLFLRFSTFCEER